MSAPSVNELERNPPARSIAAAHRWLYCDILARDGYGLFFSMTNGTALVLLFGL